MTPVQHRARSAAIADIPYGNAPDSASGVGLRIPAMKNTNLYLQAEEGLARRREQKLINAVGAHLGKETLVIEDIISLKGRMRCEVNKADQSESFYLDDTLLVTFLQPEFIADGDAIMVKQGYGPVGV